MQATSAGMWMRQTQGPSMRLAARVDDNQARIVNALRRIGCNVLSLAALGSGAPDLLCHHAGKLFLLEVKDGSKAPSKRKLTHHQELFHQHWPVRIVENEEQAIAAIQEGI